MGGGWWYGWGKDVDVVGGFLVWCGGCVGEVFVGVVVVVCFVV